MNKFHIASPLNEPLGTPHMVEMTLSPAANEPGAFGEVFRVAFEVEIMQGFWFAHDDGSTTYCFELNDEKAEQLKQALTLAFFTPMEN